MSAAKTPQPSRFADCHARIAKGCGGHHEEGPLFAGRPITIWICCPSCPHRQELNGMPPDRPYDEHVDAVKSYYDACSAIGTKVRAGEQLPLFFQSTRGLKS